MHSSGSNTEKLRMDSPLTHIATYLARMYFYRKFPRPVTKGLLDYSKIRQAPLDAGFHRKLHGFQNAARCAGLIPVLFAFYKKHQAFLKPKIALELASVDAKWIKIIQILALMRSTGRSSDVGSGKEFCQQAKRECCQFLKELGLSGAEADQYSNLLLATEGEEKINFLGSSLLADAATIESFRDDALTKFIRISMLPFVMHLDPKFSTKEPLQEFAELCCHHAAVIKSHQGFLYYAMLDVQGHPLKDWPALEKYRSRYNEQTQTIQKVFEYDEKCFEKCEQAVNFKGLANNLELLFKKQPEKHQQLPSKAEAQPQPEKGGTEARKQAGEARGKAADERMERWRQGQSQDDFTLEAAVARIQDQKKAEIDPLYIIHFYAENVFKSYLKSNTDMSKMVKDLRVGRFTDPSDFQLLDNLLKELEEIQAMIFTRKFNGTYILKKDEHFRKELDGVFDRALARKNASSMTPGKMA